MSKLDEELKRAIGLPVTLEEKKALYSPEPVRSDDGKILEDFDTVRINIETINQRGLEVFERAAVIATETEDVKVLEALGGLVEKLTKSNLALLEAHEKKRKIIAGDNVKDSSTSTINIDNRKIVMGTTEDIIQQLKNNED